MASISDNNPNKSKPTIFDQEKPGDYVPPGMRNDWLKVVPGDPELAADREVKPGVLSGLNEKTRVRAALGVLAVTGGILAIQPVGHRLYNVFRPGVVNHTDVVKTPNGVQGGVEFQTQTTETPEINP